MSDKTEIRSTLSADVDAFLKAGGKIVTVKTVHRKARNSVSGHQKVSFGWRAPVNRPTANWDMIEVTDK